MRVIRIETTCDETGVALYSTRDGLLAQRLHSQVQMHERYGGVVPELASRDHVQRLAPMIEATLADAGLDFDAIDGIAYTEGPGLAGALLVGAALARSLAFALDRPAIGVHHLEGHLVAPLLADRPPAFPFVALLVSGGHTQLLEARALGDYRLLGDTVDDAAGEAFDKSAKLLGLGYPGGPALAALAAQAPAQAPADAVDRGSRFRLPRPKLRDADLDFSFSGLKTAVLTRLRKGVAASDRPAFAREIEQAITDVLVAKAVAAIERTGRTRLVIAGGVSANTELRRKLDCAAARLRRTHPEFEVFYPPPGLCTDNGAMIALAGALRLAAGAGPRSLDFDVRPRWPLESLSAP
ncbi:MAG: tRNA (adenosine(37)-N6)-threonylcarbamoyltransferase complex transferase subunit TsaD [Burkholderiaceae bacterium]